MDLLSIAIVLFIVLEILNIALLYFAPDSRRGNALGFFNAFEKSKSDPEVHALIKYLVNWVAGTKIIFIVLLIVILFAGNEASRTWAIVALILSISVFYWRLFPAIKKMDANDQLTPKGYSKTLKYMIAGFLLVFITAIAGALIW